MPEIVDLPQGRKRPPVKRKNFKRITSGRGTKKVTRRKIKPLSKLKKELETLQKLVVVKLYGNDCYTCEAIDLEGKNKHLGHVPWPRTDLSVQAKFSHEYTRIQCMVCNIHKGGAGAKAYERMIEEKIDVQSLRENSDKEKGKTVPRQWFLEKIQEYQDLLITQLS